MLSLKNITKDYLAGENTVRALRNVSVDFGDSGFVAVLGASGCGKTTLLNIIGGLDRYTSGDLLINGRSTKDFADSDWDAYRNNTVGFVFQSYNLIPHLTVLNNVEIALTLSGVGSAERKRRAAEGLRSVGLGDQLNKRPNQLSGGQMQRVAIARALVNNPKILLADEPTGALDSGTSAQIMDILKEISRDRLVIMVTHNEEVAEKYATRIISLKDGEITADNRTEKSGAASEPRGGKYTGGSNTSMSFLTAVKLSFNNLGTKKLRTALVSVAGSIGIIGIALVLAITSGMGTFIDDTQRDALAGYPITISSGEVALTIQTGGGMMSGLTGGTDGSGDKIHTEYPNGDAHVNVIDENFVDYVNRLDSNLYSSISYSYGMKLNVLYEKSNGEYKLMPTAGIIGGMMGFAAAPSFYELPKDRDFALSQCEPVGESGRFPENASEVVLILGENNGISKETLENLGFDVKKEYVPEDFLGREYRVINNDLFYKDDGVGIFMKASEADYADIYAESELKLTVVGVYRLNAAAAGVLAEGIGYTVALTEQMLADAGASKVVAAQKAALGSPETVNKNVVGGAEFSSDDEKESILRETGAVQTPTGISIYPIDFAAKEEIKKYLDYYNDNIAEDGKELVYTDLAGMIFSAMGTLIDTIAVILSAFAGISLVVSSLMIGIITYVSVVERTKEIGVLRSIGARKKDISRVFNAETMLIGFAAGAIGIIATYLLSIPINVIVKALTGVENIAALPFFYAAALILVSIALTLVAGIIPSRIAAKRDPVAALRSE
ncbi:MAG: ABC transporter ATP-binding protein/permease [Clostridiales bacterium]|jgi:putative ABC transport system permease protein|nr:ABC transporter ATP-binding protein/permease [Clostridiales bacterium]